LFVMRWKQQILRGHKTALRMTPSTVIALYINNENGLSKGMADLKEAYALRHNNRVFAAVHHSSDDGGGQNGP
jgi:hypothetical protein